MAEGTLYLLQRIIQQAIKESEGNGTPKKAITSIPEPKAPRKLRKPKEAPTPLRVEVVPADIKKPKATRKAPSGAQRICGTCGEGGHNKRTCPKRA